MSAAEEIATVVAEDYARCVLRGIAVLAESVDRSEVDGYTAAALELIGASVKAFDTHIAALAESDPYGPLAPDVACLTLDERTAVDELRRRVAPLAVELAGIVERLAAIGIETDRIDAAMRVAFPTYDGQTLADADRPVVFAVTEPLADLFGLAERVLDANGRRVLDDADPRLHIAECIADAVRAARAAW